MQPELVYSLVLPVFSIINLVDWIINKSIVLFSYHINYDLSHFVKTLEWGGIRNNATIIVLTQRTTQNSNLPPYLYSTKVQNKYMYIKISQYIQLIRIGLWLCLHERRMTLAGADPGFF
jgi:hypothetical protein